MNWWNVQEFWWLVIGSFILLLDVFLSEKKGIIPLGMISLGLMIAALVGLFLPGYQGLAFEGSYESNQITLFFKAICVAAGIASTWMAIRENASKSDPVRESVSLSWFVIAGMGLMASARDFLLLFVAIELVTISFYVLVSLRRKEAISLEAGLKYLITGGLSTAFLVFGIALIYGSSGHLLYADVVSSIAHSGKKLLENPVFISGTFMVLAGISFKASLIPFHWWAPDVYQGAPHSATAFLSVGSKTAGFAALVMLLGPGGPLSFMTVSFGTFLSWIAVSSILFGSLGGLAQRDLSRLIGYSGVANAGFILLALCGGGEDALNAALFYIFVYGISLLLLMLLIGHLSVQTGKIQFGFSEIAGLANVNPTLGWVCALSVASLAGIPPMAGFWAKWFALSSAWAAGYQLQTVIAVIGAVISVVYYLGIVRNVFFEAASDVFSGGVRVGMPLGYRFCVSLLLALTLVAGFTPNLFVKLTTVFQ